jgi:glycosyltransferase involved in cell wall biosynthesis
MNGMLVDATDPKELANGIIYALEKPALRETAKTENARIIAERATYEPCKAMTEAFYEKIVKRIQDKIPE